MSTSFGPELARLCKARLGEITDADIAALTNFAERRLVELGVPFSCGEDVTQRALHAVLHGLEKGQGGRKPRLDDVNDKTAFRNYLRGIVSSLLYSMTRTRGFRTTQQWDDNLPRAALSRQGGIFSLRLWSARTRPRFGSPRPIASRRAMSCRRTPRQLPQSSIPN